MILTCINPTTDILGDPEKPDWISNKDSQLLYGEKFQVEEEHGAYVYGHSLHDNYKGYVDRGNLIKAAPQHNAIVAARMAHLYEEASFKSRPDLEVSIGSRLTLTNNKKDDFIETYDGYWVFKGSVQSTDDYKAKDDLADLALKYFDTPYLYGGRSIFGIDCSGLVQMAMILKDLNSPSRDSADQEKNIGRRIKEDNVIRNDIVFFKDHVGIMLDNKNILNATARHMSTVIEPLDDLIKLYNGITRVKRP